MAPRRVPGTAAPAALSSRPSRRGALYSTGIGHLEKLADITAETWAHQFATNVTGAALATAAALPHLEARAWGSPVGEATAATAQAGRGGVARIMLSWTNEATRRPSTWNTSARP